MSSESSEQPHIHLRIAIIGIQRERVAKVLSILHSLPPIQDFKDEPFQRKINVEYIPCVASFDSYQDENGYMIRYLLKLEHYLCESSSLSVVNISDTQNRPAPPISTHGQSLAPFFDEPYGIEKIGNTIRIRGIAAFTIGCGIEQEEDISAVMHFLKMLSGDRLLQGEKGEEETEDSIQDPSFFIPCIAIAPNKEYSSMMEENLAYKQLTVEEKEEATELQTIGPGKMAKFVREVVLQRLPRTKNQIQLGAIENESSKDMMPFDPLAKLKEYDTRLVRYACKICRTILFSETDLQSPSHNKNLHRFSSRKTKSGTNISSNRCESVFLADGVEWMGDIASSSEGKFSCPKCHNKLGLYRWHGNQCSCGTWVAPAIQIHSSKVDVISPNPIDSMMK